MKKILENSFYQLLVVYTALVFIIAIGVFNRFSLQMSIFAVIVAAFGFFTLETKEDKLRINKKIHYILLSLVSLFIIIIRVIPYIGNSIPLGYDTGLYKYGIEYGLQNFDKWILVGGMEPGFLYLMKTMSWIFSTQTILTWVLIFFCLLLGLSIWFFTKEYFNKEIALISILIYAVSVIQFQTFTYMYYKNIMGLSLALCAFVFLKKSQDKNYRILFIITAAFLGAIHRPTFYIFGISYLFYVLILPWKNKMYDWKKLRTHAINGLSIVVITSLFYVGKFLPALFILSDVAQGFVQTGESPGTFISFFGYQYSTLAYLPFSILGFVFLFRKRQFNPLFFWALITGIIVYFQFFFFNRFIIHLDVALIILASLGFSVLISQKKKLGTIILIIMLISSGISITLEATNSKPKINNLELQTISYLQNTEPNAFAMTTNSIYSPWLQGYSERSVIAPGFLDYNKHNRQQWNLFWSTQEIEEIKEFLNSYEKPLYIFIGEQQEDTLAQFNESGCFIRYFELQKNKIYKYNC